MRDWDDIYSDCPHGLTAPYCPSCTGDRLKADLDARREARVARGQAVENVRLRGVVANQSAALDSANARLRNLQRRATRPGKQR